MYGPTQYKDYVVPLPHRLLWYFSIFMVTAMIASPYILDSRLVFIC